MLVLLGALGVGGCGGDDDGAEDAVRRVLGGLYSCDGDRLRSEVLPSITPGLRKALVGPSGATASVKALIAECRRIRLRVRDVSKSGKDAAGHQVWRLAVVDRYNAPADVNSVVTIPDGDAWKVGLPAGSSRRGDSSG